MYLACSNTAFLLTIATYDMRNTTVVQDVNRSCIESPCPYGRNKRMAPNTRVVSTHLRYPAEAHAQVVRIALPVALVMLLVLLVED